MQYRPDCGTSPKSALDLKRGWVDYPRPRRPSSDVALCGLETVEALQKTLASHPKAKLPEHKHLAFMTRRGGAWAKQTAVDPVYGEVKKLLVKLDLHCPGLGFYALRHTFETIGGRSRDQAGVPFDNNHAERSIHPAILLRKS